ncbi:ATP-binding protein [Planobispora longispora]|uniref:ATP-binding protein n=1 Tax=Planobispora longispora TaxID=28887 RepID=UPI0019424F8D|nr:LuxR C-terminal-related transcriptional regulator [Planobispora longispora]
MSARRGSGAADTGRCEHCGAELRERTGAGGAGRPARFCSGACRQRARRLRAAAEKGKETGKPAELAELAEIEERAVGKSAELAELAEEATGEATGKAGKAGNEAAAVPPSYPAPYPVSSTGPVPLPVAGLPAPLDKFVGREDELTELKALLGRARLLTLVGPGGAGKSRLALELAERVRGAYPGGTRLVELAELAELADGSPPVRRAAADPGVTRFPADRAEAAAQAVADSLGAGKVLLILDNCEHLIDASARFAVTLLRCRPGLAVLATSRQALEAPGEHLFPVPRLSLPAPGGTRTRGELLRSDAVRLFAERARAVFPSFELTAGNGDEIAEICARLDGNALAIELAASRVRLWSVGEILSRLDDRFRLLSGGARTVAPRHRDMRAAIGWSYELLTPREREVFRRLSVLTGGFTADGAVAVCAGTDLTREEVLDLLGGLETKSLIVPEQDRSRFGMAESIRLYGYERLVEAGEADRVYERFVRWLLGLAAPAVAETRLLWSAHELDPLDGELDALRHAVDWAERRGDDRGVLLAVALSHCLWRRGRIVEGRRLLGRTLAGTDPAFPGRGVALAQAGNLALLQGEADRALSLAREAVALGEAGGRPMTLARALATLQAVQQARGDLGAADDASRRCLELLRSSAGLLDIAVCLRDRARLAVLTGDLDDADALLQECLTAHLSHGNGPVPVEWLDLTAMLALARGDTETADRRLRDGLARYRTAPGETAPEGSARGLPSPLVLELVRGLAVVAAGREEAARALRLAAAAEAFGREQRLHAGVCLGDLLDAAVTSARSALSAPAAAAAEGEGRRFGAAQLIAYALDEGVRPRPRGAGTGETVLTGREREVAKLVAEGLANRQIARRLHVSERTVHTHLERIRAKLDLPSRAHIVRWWVGEKARGDG